MTQPNDKAVMRQALNLISHINSYGVRCISHWRTSQKKVAKALTKAREEGYKTGYSEGYTDGEDGNTYKPKDSK